jgi:selenocysteine lyase/cysteine desulfurase
LPTGGGSTGAIEKAVHFLKNLGEMDLTWKEPSIFITPYEHHSNILPWV